MRSRSGAACRRPHLFDLYADGSRHPLRTLGFALEASRLWTHCLDFASLLDLVPIFQFPYGNSGGGILRFVACSNAYAISMRRGSLHAPPVKLMPSGAGFASNPAGNGGCGAFGTKPNGTITVGYPGFAATAAPVDPRKQQRIEPLALHHRIDAFGAGHPYVCRAIGKIARAIALEIDLV